MAPIVYQNTPWVVFAHIRTLTISKIETKNSSGNHEEHGEKTICMYVRTCVIFLRTCARAFVYVTILCRFVFSRTRARVCNVVCNSMQLSLLTHTLNTHKR